MALVIWLGSAVGIAKFFLSPVPASEKQNFSTTASATPFQFSTAQIAVEGRALLGAGERPGYDCGIHRLPVSLQQPAFPADAPRSLRR